MTRRDFMMTGALVPALQSKRPLPITCFFSKHWSELNCDQLGKQLRQAGFGGVDLTVRREGHVLPERAAQDLPRAYETLRSHGLAVPMITTELVSASDPTARPILGTAARLGIRFFKLGYYRWGNDVGKTLAEVGTALRGLVELAKEYGITAGFHNHASYVGQAVWDTQTLIANLDPKRIGYYFDFGHAVAEGGVRAWEIALRLASPRLKMAACKDFYWDKTDGKWGRESCALGEGMVDWPKAFSLLAAAGFSGPISIQQEYTPADKRAAMRKDLAFVNRHIEAAYGA